MKNVFKVGVIFSLFCILVCQSCSKSNVKKSADSVDVPVVLQAGPWTVSSLMQRSENKSSQFEGYVFTFSPGGTLKVEKSGSIISGSWLYTPSAVVYYGATGSTASVTIQIASSTALSRLNKRWNIDSLHTSASTLTLVSPEVAEQETVIFVRQ